MQGAFQHGDALTAAGLATLATNAVPIAAGFVVFGEQLPHGRGGRPMLLRSVFLKSLRELRRGFAWWSVGLASMSALMVSVYRPCAATPR